MPFAPRAPFRTLKDFAPADVLTISTLPGPVGRHGALRSAWSPNVSGAGWIIPAESEHLHVRHLMLQMF